MGNNRILIVRWWISWFSIFSFILFLIFGNGVLVGSSFWVPFWGKYNVNHGEYFGYSKDIDNAMHLAEYYNIGGCMDLAANSDIIMIGNSRMQMAWDPKIVRLVAKENNISIYNLAVGHAEGFAFFNALIKKYPIYNKVVLVHVDKYFQIHSGPAKESENNSLEVYFRFFDRQTMFRLKNLSELFGSQKLTGLLELKPIDSLLLKSFVDGFWNSTHFPNMDQKGPQCVEVYNSLISTFRETDLESLVVELIARGCFVILTTIPTTDSSSADAEEIAQAMGVSFLKNDLHDVKLDTFDGSHLARTDAKKFTEVTLPKIIEIAKSYYINKGMR